MRDSNLFNKSVTLFFEPLARMHNFPLSKINDGVYEISSPYFIMRIRLHTGHARGLNVTLRQASQRDFDENEPGIEYGIGCFVLFNGQSLKQLFIDVFTDEDFLQQAQLLAEAVKHFGIPYLIGQKNDFETVKEMIDERGESECEEIKKYRFPPFVQKRWHLPKYDDNQ